MSKETNSLQTGGTIPLDVAQRKAADYKNFKTGSCIEGQTDFVVFNRIDLETWLKGLPEYVTQISVFLGLEVGELDVFFWPYDHLNKKARDESGLTLDGYNIGDRHPMVHYEEL